MSITVLKAFLLATSLLFLTLAVRDWTLAVFWGNYWLTTGNQIIDGGSSHAG